MSIDSIVASAASKIAGAIQQAARSTGASFEYLLTTAKIESNLNPRAQASTTSAQGLYQFIDQTWLATLKSAGPALGYGGYAKAITQGMDGRFEVTDPAARAGIMRLRDDPAASSMMAGAFARSNAAQLTAALGRTPTEGELYIAHFLGSDGAAKLIAAASSPAQTTGAELFPQAAGANRSIFYDRTGRARSARDVYAALTGRYEMARAVAFTPSLQALASNALPSARSIVTDTAGTTQAFAKANEQAPPMPDPRPLFQAMFTDRSQAVAQTVANLWTPAAAAPAQPHSQQPPAQAPDPLNLFTNTPVEARKIFGGDKS